MLTITLLGTAATMPLPDRALTAALALTVTAGMSALAQADNNEKHFSVIEAASNEDSLTIPEIAKKCRSSVVAIETETKVVYNTYDNDYYNPFGGMFGYGFGYGYGNRGGRGGTQEYTQKAAGSGVIISEDGYVLTNNHVISGADKITVYVNSGEEGEEEQTYEATLVGSSENNDIAVLKIDARGLQAAEFGDSSKLRVGDSVVAIGDPLGVQLRGTMTNGIISAINRDLTVNDRTMNLIQTNAALNNGNSGGPLINCYGQVIGINTMKMSNFYSSSTTVEGIGFAIPIDTAKPIIDELIEKGYVSGRPAIGIDGETLPATYRIYYRLPEGIYVTRVYASSDAAAKGVSEGDIITAINGIDVTTMEQLNRVKNQFTAGQTVTLTIYRSGSSYDVEIILMDRANA